MSRAVQLLVRSIGGYELTRSISLSPEHCVGGGKGDSEGNDEGEMHIAGGCINLLKRSRFGAERDKSRSG